MKRVLWIAALVLLPALAAGQTPDTATEEGRLRAEIERRFADHLRQELSLTPDQVAKLQATQQRFGTRRRDLMRRQMDHRMALQRQMQPGIAANPDSVRVHMDGLQAGRAELFKVEQDEDRDMAGYLTPVQRARFQMLRERFIEHVQDLHRHRGGMRPGGGGPGVHRGPGGGMPGGRGGVRPRAGGGQRPPPEGRRPHL